MLSSDAGSKHAGKSVVGRFAVLSGAVTQGVGSEAVFRGLNSGSGTFLLCDLKNVTSCLFTSFPHLQNQDNSCIYHVRRVADRIKKSSYK